VTAANVSDGASLESPVTPFEKRVGHHPALFALFFAEMWERFSYYGMRALLVFYMTRGFLHYDDNRSYGVYGAYTALVYMTPFIGGLVADRLLGQRAAVIIGGSLMALGHLVMTVQSQYAFFVALALLICGNGFFKPNIGTILGSLYGVERLNGKRDGAFTIFYMGVNLGAAMAPLLCGYVGETYGWHYGFGLATIGMMIGLAIFIAPTIVTQVLIGCGAAGAAVALIYSGSAQTGWVLAVNVFVAVALLVAMVFALWALQNGALPKEAGAPKSLTNYGRNLGIVLGAVGVIVPAFAGLCYFTEIAGYVLYVVGAVALAYVIFEAFRVTKIERERLFVILIMCVFSMLFWAFFEQAGSSINNFTDRNVDRVTEARHITESDVGSSLELELNQEQLGYPDGNGTMFALDQLNAARSAAQEAGETEAHATWTIRPEHVGMGIDGDEVPASVFQAANPVFILVFGLVFTALWGFLYKRNIEPSTPTKFVFALLQLGLGFGALWLGARYADARGMVGMSWLLLAYLLHTTGELCLSPVGLSMVSKMAPARMVATMMGAWYLATAFSQFFAGLIAMLTGVQEDGAEGPQVIPPPIETLHLYADVFAKIAVASFAAAVVLMLLTPFVKRWMHEAPHAPEAKPRASDTDTEESSSSAREG
jgi:POT family proton-dependent oligopeptide transporter